MHKKIKFNELSLKKNTTVKDAVTLLTKYSHGIVYVLDCNKQVLGTITDGDIRNALLKGLTLQSDVIKIMNKSFIKCSEFDDDNVIKQKMETNFISQIPILATNGTLLDTKHKRDLVNERSKFKENLDVFVIMAGGLGSRLMPLTKDIPKPLIPVRDKPLVQHLINSAKKHGFKKFIVCLNYRSDQIRNYLGDGSSQGVDIHYIVEDQRSGTAGSLFLCKENLTENFIVANADLLTTCNFSELLNSNVKNQKLITVGAISKEMSVEFGVMECDGYTLKSIHEKPSIPFLINSGIYALNKKAVLSYPERGFVDMTDIIQYHLEKNSNSINVFPIFESWHDIGTHESLMAAREDK